jgi:hypothetical protein
MHLGVSTTRRWIDRKHFGRPPDHALDAVSAIRSSARTVAAVWDRDFLGCAGDLGGCG